MDWRVLELLHVLDEGAYGVVLAVKHRETGELFAVKAGKHASADPRVMHQTLREVKILRSISPHPNVVRLADAFRSEEEHIYLVFPQLYAGLHRELERVPGRLLTGVTLKLVAWQLLHGLLHCHDHQIVHRDVKPANVLISRAIAPPPPPSPKDGSEGASSSPRAEGSDGSSQTDGGCATQQPPSGAGNGGRPAQFVGSGGSSGSSSGDGGDDAAAAAAAPLVKLCDFGFARHVYCSEPWYGERYSSYVVTRYYRAPEVLVGCKYGTSVDIWSYGCTLAELATGRPLFPGTSTLDQLGLITRCLGPLPPQQSDALAEHIQLGPQAARAITPATGRGRPLKVLLQGTDPQLLDLVAACLELDPRRRPTAKRLLQMPYFDVVPQLLAGTDLDHLLHSPTAAAMGALAVTPPTAARRVQHTAASSLPARTVSMPSVPAAADGTTGAADRYDVIASDPRVRRGTRSSGYLPAASYARPAAAHRQACSGQLGTDAASSGDGSGDSGGGGQRKEGLIVMTESDESSDRGGNRLATRILASPFQRVSGGTVGGGGGVSSDPASARPSFTAVMHTSLSSDLYGGAVAGGGGAAAGGEAKSGAAALPPRPKTPITAATRPVTDSAGAAAAPRDASVVAAVDAAAAPDGAAAEAADGQVHATCEGTFSDVADVADVSSLISSTGAENPPRILDPSRISVAVVAATAAPPPEPAAPAPPASTVAAKGSGAAAPPPLPPLPPQPPTAPKRASTDVPSSNGTTRARSHGRSLLCGARNLIRRRLPAASRTCTNIRLHHQASSAASRPSAAATAAVAAAPAGTAANAPDPYSASPAEVRLPAGSGGGGAAAAAVATVSSSLTACTTRWSTAGWLSSDDGYYPSATGGGGGFGFSSGTRPHMWSGLSRAGPPDSLGLISDTSIRRSLEKDRDNKERPLHREVSDASLPRQSLCKAGSALVGLGGGCRISSGVLLSETAAAAAAGTPVEGSGRGGGKARPVALLSVEALAVERRQPAPPPPPQPPELSFGGVAEPLAPKATAAAAANAVAVTTVSPWWVRALRTAGLSCALPPRRAAAIGPGGFAAQWDEV